MTGKKEKAEQRGRGPVGETHLFPRKKLSEGKRGGKKSTWLMESREAKKQITFHQPPGNESVTGHQGLTREFVRRRKK